MLGLTRVQCRKKASIPVYSFAEHQRQPQTTTLYSPRVIVLEGILALHGPRIVELLDVKVWPSSLPRFVIMPINVNLMVQIFVEADMDVCLGRRRKFLHIRPWQK